MHCCSDSASLKLSREDFAIATLQKEENCYEAYDIDNKIFVFAEFDCYFSGTN